ncbi:MAG: TIGR02757 family protein [Bacteroidales bacterium]|nr:TIGR02757 family protein [Bacteroidales bacterium]MCM1147352.1 TIGR02757 family protein [Bacteroidales bacterium]MCM1206212.1 TIGR02757 family protein [Bacillota bacterium]MCM1510446.1 TIGR02757 family protein [Clostridium sp.]
MSETSMNTELNIHLKSLAFRYEKREFLAGDPSWFMHQIEGDANKELLAFIASSLSYGSRKQFLPKIQSLLDSVMKDAEGCVSKWLTEHRYEAVVPPTSDCFYRLYTCQAFNSFLKALAGIIMEYGTIKNYVVHYACSSKSDRFTQCVMSYNAADDITTDAGKSIDALMAVEAITTWFREHGSIGIIPKDTTSSCKRICMFLRWMVRDSSPVDLGLWNDIIDKRTLIIPMDTHVVQEAMRLNLLTSKSTSMSNARKLSRRLLEIFPDDPLKGDFALFGLGVDTEQK